MNTTTADKWQHFTDTEIDILYSALALYRKQCHKVIQQQAHKVADDLIADLINIPRKGN